MNIDALMRTSIFLARKGGRSVEPNPLVGCIIVKDGSIISRGWHKRYGGPHAEIEALRKAGEQAKGATMIVNLEPCNHEGKTPPCTEAITQAGIHTVVVGMRDLNPDVRGRGIEYLRSHGVQCMVGILEDECRKLNKRFIVNVTEKRPFVSLKMALTLDGFIAPLKGSSQWITDEESRNEVQTLRTLHDAVLVGAGTIRSDNPRLTVRSGSATQPYRVVQSMRLRLPPQATILTDEFAERTIIFTSKDAIAAKRSFTEQLERRGVAVYAVRKTKNGLSLPASLRLLFDHNIRSILVEGGSKVYSSFLQAGLVDVMHVFAAPIILGRGRSAFGDLGGLRLNTAFRFDLDTVRKLSTDCHIVLSPSKG